MLIKKYLDPLATANAALEAHQANLENEKQKAAAELEKQKAAADARLAPLAEAARALATKLVELTSKRDTLSDQLRVAKRQLYQQQELVEEAERMIEGQFGVDMLQYGPGVFAQIVHNRPAAMLAGRIVPKLEAWIAQREKELASVEDELAALAKSATAKAPATA